MQLVVLCFLISLSIVFFFCFFIRSFVHLFVFCQWPIWVAYMTQIKISLNLNFMWAIQDSAECAYLFSIKKKNSIRESTHAHELEHCPHDVIQYESLFCAVLHTNTHSIFCLHLRREILFYLWKVKNETRKKCTLDSTKHLTKKKEKKKDRDTHTHIIDINSGEDNKFVFLLCKEVIYIWILKTCRIPHVHLMLHTYDETSNEF